MPMPDFSCPRVVPPGERHGEPWADGSGGYVGEGERGIIPPDRPSEQLATARIVRDGIAAVVVARGLRPYGGEQVLAESVGVGRPELRRWAAEGIQEGHYRGAVLDAVESVEGTRCRTKIRRLILERRAITFAGG